MEYEYTRESVIEGFRRLADLLEANPMMELPFSGGPDSAILFMSNSRDAFAATVKAFGIGRKEDGGNTLDFVPEFPLNVKVFGFKNSICEHRTVTRTVEATPEVTIPARVIAAVEAHEETITEYVCAPFLRTDKPEPVEAQPWTILF